MTESGEFAFAERCRRALDRGADSLDLVVRALLAEDLGSSWDTLQAPLPPRPSRGRRPGPGLRVTGDSIPPDPAEVRTRLERLNESTRRRQREIAVRRNAQVRSGWVLRANTLVEALNAAVGLDAEGSRREALHRLAAVRDSAATTLAEMMGDTTWWPGRAVSRRLQPPSLAPTGGPPPPRTSSPPSDPEEAVREVLRLVELNLDAVRYNLAVALYHDVSQRLALGHARRRIDAARIDSLLTDPHLDSDLRRMVGGLRQDLEVVH